MKKSKTSRPKKNMDYAKFHSTVALKLFAYIKRNGRKNNKPREVKLTPLSIEKLLVRDMFTCHLCGGLVCLEPIATRRASTSYNLVPSLDRTSSKLEYSEENCKLSHFKCNIQKGNNFHIAKFSRVGIDPDSEEGKKIIALYYRYIHATKPEQLKLQKDWDNSFIKSENSLGSIFN